MSIMSISLWICNRLWLWVRLSGWLGHRGTSGQGSEQQKLQEKITLVSASVFGGESRLGEKKMYSLLQNRK